MMKMSRYQATGETDRRQVRVKVEKKEKKRSYLGMFSALMMVEEPSSFFSFLGLRV